MARGRVWRPKYKHLCAKCGWTGVRSLWARKCPRCGFWRPKPVGKT